PVLEARLQKSRRVEKTGTSQFDIFALCSIFTSVFKQVSSSHCFFTIHTIEFINSLHSTTVSNKAFILVLLNISSWKEKTSVLTS
ncbi:MAG: hypothetical protein ACI90V_007141, partial [Bacillariaceae sp.]